MKKGIALLLAALFTLPILSGCNTLEGAGQDIERAGEGIQGETRENR